MSSKIEARHTAVKSLHDIMQVVPCSSLYSLAEAVLDAGYAAPVVERQPIYEVQWNSIHGPEGWKVVDAPTYARCQGPLWDRRMNWTAPPELAELQAELSKARHKIEQAWNKPTPNMEGYIPGAFDAWERPVKQHLHYDFSGNPGASATQYCNGWNDSGGYWKNHANELQATITELIMLLGQARGMANGASDEWHNSVKKVLGHE
jgi:hypothetical protein